MKAQDYKDVIRAAIKESVTEAIAELEQEAIDEIKGALLPVLQDRKQALIKRLQDEIAQTSGLGVKARNYLYLILVRIMDKMYAKIENQLGM